MTNQSGQIRFEDTQRIICEINYLLHNVLDKDWLSKEWSKIETNPNADVHPFIKNAYIAHKQIQKFISENNFGITFEIIELTELAYKINLMYKSNVIGLDKRLSRLTSFDFDLYRSSRYEIQIAGMLQERGHIVQFIQENILKAPDILVSNYDSFCEFECKYKDPVADQIDYIKSIYNNTQTARKQFSKQFPAIITIDIDAHKFDSYQKEIDRLKGEIERALRNSSTISAILLTSKILMEDYNDFVYRHRVIGFKNTNARQKLPDWLEKNLVTELHDI